MLYNELEIFYRKPDAVQQMRCRVCGAVCTVFRGEYGPTCWSAALAGLSVCHDRFVCPHSGETWHDQARGLYTALQREQSRWLAALKRLELGHLCRRGRRHHEVKPLERVLSCPHIPTKGGTP